jgi:DNA-binding CsgD family transcriptional regulator
MSIAVLPDESWRWSQQVSFLIDKVHQSDFIAALCSTLESFLHFDSLGLVVFSDHCPPELKFTSAHSDQDYFSQTYRPKTCLADPLYQQSTTNIKPGLFRREELLGGAYWNSDFCRQFYRDQNLKDEASILVPVEDGKVALLILARRGGSAEFQPSDWRQLAMLSPIVVSSLRQHMRYCHSESEPQAEDYQRAMAGFGQGKLTARERQITKLLLQGYCAKEIARELGITYGTVKIHRKNLYTKLEISSQSQLFNLFMHSSRQELKSCA